MSSLDESPKYDSDDEVVVPVVIVSLKRDDVGRSAFIPGKGDTLQIPGAGKQKTYSTTHVSGFWTEEDQKHNAKNEKNVIHSSFRRSNASECLLT